MLRFVTRQGVRTLGLRRVENRAEVFAAFGRFDAFIIKPANEHRLASPAQTADPSPSSSAVR